MLLPAGCYDWFLHNLIVMLVRVSVMDYHHGWQLTERHPVSLQMGVRCMSVQLWCMITRLQCMSIKLRFVELQLRFVRDMLRYEANSVSGEKNIWRLYLWMSDFCLCLLCDRICKILYYCEGALGTVYHKMCPSLHLYLSLSSPLPLFHLSYPASYGPVSLIYLQ